MKHFLLIACAVVFLLFAASFTFFFFPNSDLSRFLFNTDECKVSDYSTAQEYEKAALEVEAYEQDSTCAILLWQKVVEKRPTDVSALANTAIRLSQAERHQESLAYYANAIKLGGGAWDTFAWYARSLRQLNQIPMATEWYYRTLSVEPNLSDITAELSELLALQNQHYEAMSVLSGYEEMTESESYFKARKITLRTALDSLPDDQKKASFRVPKLYNDHFYIFSRLSESKSHKGKAFLVDTGASRLTLNQAWLKENDIDYRTIKRVRAQLANGKKIKVKLVKIPFFQLGPFKLKNVKALVCKQCSPLIGQNILERFDLNTKRVNGVEFLYLEKRRK